MHQMEWILNLLAKSGYAGIGVMMLVADIVVFIPSEVITPLAGFVSAREGLSFWGAVFAATLGSVLGGLPWYYLGWTVQQHGLDRWLNEHPRFLGVPSASIRKAEQWFHRHGSGAVLTARLLPGIRPLIGIPAGAARMKFSLYLFFSTLGTAVWTTALVLGGWLLREEFHRAGDAAVVIGIVLGSVLAAGYGLWLLWRRRQHSLERDYRAEAPPGTEADSPQFKVPLEC
jgi:membrane protein DedA with SNARE-associated domain